MAGERTFVYSLMFFVIGVALFILGAYLVQELIIKFLKFAVGLFLIFISVPLMLGSLGWWRFFRRRGKVVRMC
ncbi:hypothetical protein JW898_03500 [Candidatus Woesearchaeota archaeon]|nr:hypothetical protein [Candidatus Woesearchaeota archaeon]